MGSPINEFNQFPSYCPFNITHIKHECAKTSPNINVKKNKDGINISKVLGLNFKTSTKKFHNESMKTLVYMDFFLSS